MSRRAASSARGSFIAANLWLAGAEVPEDHGRAPEGTARDAIRRAPSPPSDEIAVDET